MKKKKLKALKLNKKSISQLHGNAIKGGSTYYYTYSCNINCTEYCPETEVCPTTYGPYLCEGCDPDSIYCDPSYFCNPI